MPNYEIKEYDEKKVYKFNDKEYKALNSIDVGSYVTLLGTGYLPMFNEAIQKENLTKPEGQKIPLIDFEQAKADILKKVQDPETVAIIRTMEEINKKDEKATKIMKELEKEFSKLKLNETRDYLARSFKFYLKLEDTEEAKNYNRALYKNYLEHPEEFTHVRMKNLMKFDLSELVNLGTDKVKLLEFYRDNRAICMEANEFGNPLRLESFGRYKAFAKGMENFQSLIQKINAMSSIVDEYQVPAKYFAIPNLTKEQAAAINKNKVMFKGKLERYDSKMIDKMAGKYFKRPLPAEFYNKYIEKGAVIDKDFILKYKAIKTDPETNEEKEVSMLDIYEGKANVRLAERSKEEIDQISRVSKAFTNRYSAVFQNRMGKTLGETYNIFKIMDENKGGYFENLFDSTSREYKDFINALADFTNPSKEGYLDIAKLEEKTNKYLEHTENVKPAKNDTNATRQGRIRLANAVLSSLEFMKENNTAITNNINIQISSLVPDAVEHNKELLLDFGNLEEFKNEDLDKSFILDNKLDDSMDDPDMNNDI